MAYNRAVRHKEPLPDAPPGVTVGNSKDDRKDNQDLFGRAVKRTLWRMPGHSTNSNQTSNQPATPPAATNQAENQDSDLESIDESELQPQTQREKSVTFHLPRRKPTAPVFKP